MHIKPWTLWTPISSMERLERSWGVWRKYWPRILEIADPFLLLISWIANRLCRSSTVTSAKSTWKGIFCLFLVIKTALHLHDIQSFWPPNQCRVPLRSWNSWNLRVEELVSASLFISSLMESWNVTFGRVGAPFQDISSFQKCSRKYFCLVLFFMWPADLLPIPYQGIWEKCLRTKYQISWCCSDRISVNTNTPIFQNASADYWTVFQAWKCSDFENAFSYSTTLVMNFLYDQ